MGANNRPKTSERPLESRSCQRKALVVSACGILVALLMLLPRHVAAADMEILSDSERDLMFYLNPISRDGKQPDIDHLFADYLVRVSLYNQGNGECLFSDLRDACKEQAIYIGLVGMDSLGAPRFGFKTPLCFKWRVTSIKDVKAVSGKRCILFTMSEEVRERVGDQVNASQRETQVCASAQGFVEPAR